MATETLNIPEEHLADVCRVLRNGLESDPPGNIKEEVREQLTKFIHSSEKYLGIKKRPVGKGEDPDAPYPEDHQLPDDPECYNARDSLVFRNRDHHNQMRWPNFAREYLATQLKIPALWSFILPELAHRLKLPYPKNPKISPEVDLFSGKKLKKSSS